MRKDLERFFIGHIPEAKISHNRIECYPLVSSSWVFSSYSISGLKYMSTPINIFDMNLSAVLYGPPQTVRRHYDIYFITYRKAVFLEVICDFRNSSSEFT